MDFQSNNYTLTGGSITSATARTITVAGTNAATMNSVIAGAGNVTKLGTGTLILGGANTYTGTTAINAGTLRVAGSTTTLGGASAGAVTIGAAGTLELTGGVTLDNAVTVTAGGTLTSAGAAANTLTGAITGVLTKTGPANLILTGAAGAVTVSTGNLQVGAGGTTGSVASANLGVGAGDRSIVFNRSNDVAMAGAITGAGNLIKRGAGTLTLTGANTYTGTTAIEGGTLAITALSNIGTGAINIPAAGTLALNVATGGVAFDRIIDGAGAFSKTGAGTLNLTAGMTIGNVSVTGGGVLNVNSGVAGLTATAIAVTGATLTGRSYRGAVTMGDGGIIVYDGGTPLQISGSLTMGAGSRFDFALDDNMIAMPMVTVTGTTGATANLSGGTLNLTTIWAPSPLPIQIISAVGGITGQFAAVTVNGQDPAALGRVITQNVSGNLLTITIAESGSDVPEALSVDSVHYISTAADGSLIHVFLRGFDDLRPYVSAASGSRVDSVVVRYRAGLTGNLVEVRVTVPTGNTLVLPITIPDPLDMLYYVDAAVYWNDGETTQPPLISLPAVPVYPHDPRSVVRNPLKITVVDHDANDERTLFQLAVTGYGDLLTTPQTYRPHVEQVGVWIKRGDPPPVVTGNALERGTADSIIIFTVAELAALEGRFEFVAGPVAVDIETFHFAVAPLWIGGGIGDTIARPFDVYSRDVTNRPLPENPCVVTIVQPDPRAPSVSVTLGVREGEAFDALAVTVRIELSFSETMAAPIIFTQEFSRAQVEAGHQFIVENDGFVGVRRPVYYRVTVLNDAGLGRPGTPGSENIGRLPPSPITGFTVEAATGERVVLRWNPVTPAGNNVGDIDLSAIYIVYSTSALTPDVDIDAHPPVTTVPAGETSVRLDGLTPETDYWFAAVLADIVNVTRPLWTLSSPAAVITENSGQPSGNIIQIDTAAFVEEATQFHVTYSLRDNNTGPDRHPQFGYFVTLGGDTLSTEPSSPQPLNLHLADVQETFIISGFGEALMFDTVFRVHMYTIDAGGSRLPGAAEFWDIRIGSFSRQTVTVNANNGSRFVDNGRFGISADRADVPGWEEGDPSNGSFSTDISRSSAGAVPVPDGFILVSEYGYRYRVRGAGELEATFPPFAVRMKADGIPEGHVADEVRMYRWTGFFWEVIHGTRYDAASGYFVGVAGDNMVADTVSTYRLMISTQRPNVMGLEELLTRPAITIDQAIRETITIGSNVGNVRARLLNAVAHSSELSTPYSDPLVAASATVPPVAVPFRNFEFAVDRDIISDAGNYGVLSYLIVTDGRYTDTINISRRITSAAYRGFSVAPESRKWLPFAAQVELENKSPRHALSQLFGSPEEFFPYDTLFRLFRWFEHDGNRNSPRSQWVEYHGENDNIFSLEPGRLMWVKTAGSPSFNFGGATTVSLTETFTITIPAGRWVDFVLPFRFDVCIGDVLEATGHDVQLYKWEVTERGRTSHVARLLTPAAIDSSVRMEGDIDPFTIFNPGTQDIVLRIPPRPAFMSRHRPGVQPLAKNAAVNDMWYYTIRSGTGNNPELNDVMIGNHALRRAFAVPPSFANEAVVIIDSDGKSAGHYFGPELSRGGSVFTLRFHNDERQKTKFTFTAPATGPVPGDMRIMFVNAVTGEELRAGASGEYSLEVSGRSHEDVYMVVGNRDYQARIGVGGSDAKFSVSPIAVNQTARSARVRYYIPFAGVDRVEVSVYDVRGRLIWRNMERVKPASWNTMEWNSRAGRYGAAPAGLYIIRVRAIDAKGKTAAIENRRITFAR
jgi:autotransporter-associated beta strand protein